MLVVGYRNFVDVARDFRRDCKLARCDEGIVGRFEMTRVIPVEISSTRDRREEQCPARQRQRPPGPGRAC
jgi:hypothetical protein